MKYHSREFKNKSFAEAFMDGIRLMNPADVIFHVTLDTRYKLTTLGQQRYSVTVWTVHVHDYRLTGIPGHPKRFSPEKDNQ